MRSRPRCQKRVTPDRGTIQLLQDIAGDDDADRDVRDAARKVSAALVKKSRTK